MIKQYVALVVCLICGTYCFTNSYYAFRFPNKYIKARWTAMKGLPQQPGSAAYGGGMTMLGGAIFLGASLLILRALLYE